MIKNIDFWKYTLPILAIVLSLILMGIGTCNSEELKYDFITSTNQMNYNMFEQEKNNIQIEYNLEPQIKTKPNVIKNTNISATTKKNYSYKKPSRTTQKRSGIFKR